MTLPSFVTFSLVFLIVVLCSVQNLWWIVLGCIWQTRSTWQHEAGVYDCSNIVFDNKNHASLHDGMHEVVCSLKEHLQHQDGTDKNLFRTYFSCDNCCSILCRWTRSSSFTSAFMSQKAMCSFTHLFLTLIVVADRCAKFWKKSTKRTGVKRRQ